MIADEPIVNPPVDDRRSSIGRNVLHLLASQVATGLMGALLIVLEPRFLGPDSVGLLRLTVSIWTIVQVVVSLGTSTFLTLSIARDRDRGIELLGPVLVLRFILFVVSAGALAALMLAVGAEPELLTLMTMYGALVLFGTVSDAVSATFFGLERMAVPALTHTITRVLVTVAEVIALFAGVKAIGVVTVGAAGNLLAAVMLYRSVRKITTVSFGRWRVHARMIVKGSVAFLLSGVILTAYLQMDTIVISILVDESALGWYSTADALYGALLFVTTIVMSSVFPVIGRLYKEDRPAMIALVRRVASSLVLLAIPVGLGLVVVSEQLALLLFGDEFEETGDVLAVLGPVVICTFLTVLFGTVALATERQRLWNTVMAISAALTIPLDLLFVPWADNRYANGAIGGAMAYVVTELLMVTVGLWTVAPYLVTRRAASRLARIGAAGGVMFAATWTLRDVSLPATVVVGCIVYPACAVLFGAVTEHDRAAVGATLLRVGVRTRWAPTDALV